MAERANELLSRPPNRELDLPAECGKPAKLLMKKLGPNVTLPVMVTLWGMVTACQGAVKSYGGLLACRFFLGALEGGYVEFDPILSANFLTLM